MNAHRFTDWVALTIACGGGSGKLSPAPGTWGSLAAFLLLAYWRPSDQALAGVLVLSIPLFYWAVNRTVQRLSVSDPGWVVADEWQGLALGWLLLPEQATWVSWLLLFGLFRLLDATKPGPIGAVDRYLPDSWGIFVDDWLAGMLAGILVVLVI